MAKKTNKAVAALMDTEPVGNIEPIKLEDTLLIQGLIKRIQDLEEKLIAIESSVVRLSLYPIAVPAYTPSPIVTCIGDGNAEDHTVISSDSSVDL